MVGVCFGCNAPCCVSAVDLDRERQEVESNQAETMANEPHALTRLSVERALWESDKHFVCVCFFRLIDGGE